MRTIPLTRGKVAIVDDEDFERFGGFKWYADKRNAWYARRAFGPRSHRKSVYMHRQILNAPPSLECDHINGNGLDNRRCNLRLCTRSQNNMNRHRSCGGSSRFKGVGRHNPRNKWRAYIGDNGKLHHLGLFANEIDAAHAYDNAATELFGEFASLNFPHEAKGES